MSQLPSPGQGAAGRRPATAGQAPLVVQRNLILGLLLALAAAAWLLMALHAGDDAMGGAEMAGASATMGLRAPVFLAIWVVMMAAMMFPAIAPMVLAFHRIQAHRHGSGTFVPTWVFVAGYMLIWAGAGAAAYAAALAAEAVAVRTGLGPAGAARFGGAVLVAAGLYQLTPLKDWCLSKCRSPVGFIMASWREGRLGALRMGARHGLWCLGCCWLLFAVLFPLGLMNLAAMAALTALVFAEKTLRWGRLAARAAAVVLVAYGGLVLAVPAVLPTYAVHAGTVMRASGEATTHPATVSPQASQSR